MSERVGIVVVSHSAALADAALELALQMVADDPPPIATAGGTDDGGIGTDAARVQAAVEEVGSDAGVLVLMDLGSALMSAEMALEMAEPDFPVRLTSAPLVEGLVAAVVQAAAGASLDEVTAEARGALAAKASHLGDDEADGGDGSDPDGTDGAGEDHDDAGEDELTTREVELVNPHGLHARPASRFVAAAGRGEGRVEVEDLTSGRGPVDARSLSAIGSLGADRGHVLRLGASGPDAEEVLDRLVALVEDGFGEGTGDGGADTDADADAPASADGSDDDAATADDRDDDDRDDDAAPPATAGGPVGVSPGRAAGPVARMVDPPDGPPDDEDVDDTQDAAERLRAAADQVAGALRERAERAGGGTSSDVLEATATLAEDPALLDAAADRVTEQGAGPARAVWDVAADLAADWRDGGGPMAERVRDLEDVRDRLVAALTDRPAPGVPQRQEGFVLVARDLAPADTATLDGETCLAIVTARGGPTSHTAILARALGIPAVVGHPDLGALTDGRVVLVDGSTGEVELDPDQDAVDAARAHRRDVPFDGTGRTADGTRVDLLANVAGARDVEQAVEAGAQGVGLLRTEVLFLGRGDAPGVEEQREAYVELLAPFGGRKVVVRTLDAGTDKPLAFVTARDEDNPALGVRGLRIATAQPELLDTQLAALAGAVERVEADVWVMAPMVATVDEAEAFVARCREHGLGTAGVMVETPSSALRADDLLQVVDFVSIGTNDLTQYTLAADRQHGELAALNDPWQPAVLDLVALVGAAGRTHGTPVGVCGQAAADPALAVVLVGLGATSLSMPPNALGAVASALAATSDEHCAAAATLAREVRDAATARAAVRELLGDRLDPGTDHE